MEFPNHIAEFSGFDPSDKKFVAVAAANGCNTAIVQGLDFRWKKFTTAFTKAGLTVVFLC